MEKISICLDVGGTFTKGTVFDDNEKFLLDGIHYYETLAKQNREIIINNLAKIIDDLVSLAYLEKNNVVTLSIAFPGPFDYQEGISWIRDLGKFDSLYGENVKALLYDALININAKIYNKIEIYFNNDAVAFAYGEYHQSNVEKGAYFTIGTGIGSTFIMNGKRIVGEYGIPNSGMIYKEDFKNSIIDDYVSARGLNKIIDKYYLDNIDGKELSKQADNNIETALEIFREFGTTIGKVISPYIESFKPNEIIIGGQISKSLHYFKKEISYELLKYDIETPIKKSFDTTHSTLQGLFILERIEKR